MLGADNVIATRMVVADGKYTGEIAYTPTARKKAVAIRGAGRCDAATTSNAATPTRDSITDVPMLEAVGHPFAVNPDKALRQIAVERGWPVLEFAEPQQPHRTAVRRPAVAAGVVAAVAAGALLLASRRRSRSA